MLKKIVDSSSENSSLEFVVFSSAKKENKFKLLDSEWTLISKHVLRQKSVCPKRDKSGLH